MSTTFRRTTFHPVLVACLALASRAPAAPVAAQEGDADEVRSVIASAYIEGLQMNGSREDIRAGFHPSFVMKVFGDGGITDVTIEEWIARLPEEGVPLDHEITHRIPQVDISGDAASAKIEVLYDGRHVFSDYMLLYRFPEGWRIVAKIFHNWDG